MFQAYLLHSQLHLVVKQVMITQYCVHKQRDNPKNGQILYKKLRCGMSISNNLPILLQRPKIYYLYILYFL